MSITHCYMEMTTHPQHSWSELELGRVGVSEYVNTPITPQRFETCRGLWQVKWALGWLRQQCSLFDNTATRWPQRDK